MNITEATIEESVEGVSVIVPDGAELSTCVKMPSVDPNARWNAVIGKGARATLCETDIRASEIIVEEGAELELISLQMTEHPTQDALTKKIILRDGARVRLFTGLFDSVNIEVIGEMRGNKTTFENHVMYFASAKQKIRMLLNAEHHGVNTMSRTLVRGVAVQNGHAAFAGGINIHQTGSQADGVLDHEGLLLSQKSRIDSLPGLEIGTDDVKASHASAVHYIRPEQLFYLQTRGISSEAGRKMIVQGFLESMLATVREEHMLEQIHALVKERQELV